MKAKTAGRTVVVLLGGALFLGGCETAAQTGMLIGAPIGVAVAVLAARGGGGADLRGISGLELGAVGGYVAGSMVDDYKNSESGGYREPAWSNLDYQFH